MTTLMKRSPYALSALALGTALMVAPAQTLAGSNPYIGEIMATGVYGFCPRGWANTDGQLLSIASNTALFSLLGTQFGGDGRTTFGLPDLRGRIPAGVGTGPGINRRDLGQRGGSETIPLHQDQMARHSHGVNANNLDGDKPGPGGKLLAAAPTGGTGTETIYSTAAATVQMSPEMIAPTGSGAPVNVQDPTLVIRYCIALNGVFPSRP